MGSGGHNAIPIREHLARGTFRADRHGGKTDPQSVPVCAEDRARTLHGLSGDAWRVADELMTTFDDWHPAALEVLRSYALSCARLRDLQANGADAVEVHREARCNLSLLAALELDR